MEVLIEATSAKVALMPPNNFIKIAVSIRRDQKQWLDNHPSINRSGLLQEAIDTIMRKEK